MSVTLERSPKRQLNGILRALEQSEGNLVAAHAYEAATLLATLGRPEAAVALHRRLAQVEHAEALDLPAVGFVDRALHGAPTLARARLAILRRVGIFCRGHDLMTKLRAWANGSRAPLDGLFAEAPAAVTAELHVAAAELALEMGDPDTALPHLRAWYALRTELPIDAELALELNHVARALLHGALASELALSPADEAAYLDACATAMACEPEGAPAVASEHTIHVFDNLLHVVADLDAFEVVGDVALELMEDPSRIVHGSDRYRVLHLPGPELGACVVARTAGPRAPTDAQVLRFALRVGPEPRVYLDEDGETALDVPVGRYEVRAAITPRQPSDEDREAGLCSLRIELAFTLSEPARG